MGLWFFEKRIEHFSELTQGWGGWKFSGDYGFRLSTGCPTPTLRIFIAFFPCRFFFLVYTPNHWSSKWSITSKLWSTWNNFLDAIKLALKSIFYVYLFDFSMWFSICIFYIFHLYQKESGAAFSSLLKVTLTPTPRNLLPLHHFQTWSFNQNKKNKNSYKICHPCLMQC